VEMFCFTCTEGKQVWIKLYTVICIIELSPDRYTVQCTQSMWTMNKKDFKRLLRKLRQVDQDEDDWWKTGGPNPLDNENDDDE
jgi:hypothetical protein